MACSLAALCAPSAFAQDASGAPARMHKGSEPTELERVIVTGKHPYLYESDRQLDRIKAGLPGLESDSDARRKDWVEHLADYYEANKDPNHLTDPFRLELMLKVSGMDRNLGP